MRSPFVIYFAGVGTVVAALAVGFGGGIALTKTSLVKETAAMSAMRREKLRTASTDVKAESDAVVTNAGDRGAPAESKTTRSIEASLPPKSLLSITTGTPVTPSAAPAAQSVAAMESGEAAESRHASASDRKEAAVRKVEKGKRRQLAEQRRQREIAAHQQAEDDLRDDESGMREGARAATRRVVDSDRASDLDAEPETGAAVRTYETRPRGFARGFAGLFGDDDD